MKTDYRLFLFLALLLAGCSSTNGQNLALNRAYTLSSPPNYINSAPLTDKTSLTDGTYTRGQFWKSKTTDGWQNRPVTITIDLLNSSAVGSVSFNTARNTKVGVDYPQHIFVFLSDDNSAFKYVGDIANNPKNTEGDYEVNKFVLSNINTKGRYVKIVAIPKGKRVFCDEIEVIKGAATVASTQPTVSANNIKSFTDSLVAIEFNRESITRSFSAMQSTQASTDPGIAGQLNDKNISQEGLEKIKGNIEKENALKIQKVFNTSYIVEQYNPWDTLNELSIPKKDVGSLSYQFFLPQDGTRYGGFTITNSSSDVKQFSITKLNENASVAGITIYNIPFVQSINFSYVPDPLIVVNSAISINPGSTNLFMFKLSGKKSGTMNPVIDIVSGTKKVSLNIKINVVPVSIASSSMLNANVWAYLNSPMIEDIKKEAVKDLELHHINTVVINARALPKLNSKDASALIQYLGNFDKIDKILLFTKYSSKGKGESGSDFLSASWKRSFFDWYSLVSKTIHDNGFPNAQVYLYPYDEVLGADINDFKNLIVWAKAAIPGIKFFATITNQPAANTIVPLVDISEIQERENIIARLPSHKGEVWTYKNGSPARSLPPYEFYRLMAWRAFSNDATGIGFWNYASEGKDEKLNLISNRLTTPASSFSVIYNGSNKEIISSRRWEAFSLGIEDYSILKLYEKKFGAAKTKSLVNAVLADPANHNLADNTLNSMLGAL